MQLALRPVMSPQVIQEMTQAPIPSISNAQVRNFNQAQNNPFVSKMWFSNSNITINYNFGSLPNPK